MGERSAVKLNVRGSDNQWTKSSSLKNVDFGRQGMEGGRCRTDQLDEREKKKPTDRDGDETEGYYHLYREERPKKQTIDQKVCHLRSGPTVGVTSASVLFWNWR